MNAIEISSCGLYAVKRGDGSFRVAKVLVLEDDVVHVRIYAESFEKRPLSVDFSILTLGSVFTGKFGMGHLPLRLESFLSWEPTFLAWSNLAENELDGYRMWRDAGGGVFG
jgi:hypothetical protein